MTKSSSRRPLSETWEQFIQKYREYREKPVWGAWTVVPNALLRLTPAQEEMIRKRGESATKKLEAAVAQLSDGRLLPRDLGPIRFGAVIRRKLVPPKFLKILLEAIVFDRDDYACSYCRRAVNGVWQAENRRRTIRLVVDHVVPISQKGESFNLRNCATACWSCNALKGRLPKPAFLKELESLANHFLAGRNDDAAR